MTSRRRRELHLSGSARVLRHGDDRFELVKQDRRRGFTTWTLTREQLAGLVYEAKVMLAMSDSTPTTSVDERQSPLFGGST